MYLNIIINNKTKQNKTKQNKFLMNNFEQSPFTLEEKDYGPIKQNNVNFAPWYGTNTKVPGIHDILEPDIPEDKKIDITEVEIKPILKEIEKREETQKIRERKPQLLQAGIILFGAFIVLRLFIPRQGQ